MKLIFIHDIYSAATMVWHMWPSHTIMTLIPIEDLGGEADGIVDRVMITRRCTEGMRRRRPTEASAQRPRPRPRETSAPIENRDFGP